MNSVFDFLLSKAILIDAWIRNMSADNLPYYLANVFIVYVVLHAIRMILMLVLNKKLTFASNRMNTSGEGVHRILILGDSTAVGTGADCAEDSIAGRLAHDFPDAEICNLGDNGGLISDVSNQIRSVVGQKFDLIIISAGGNDVWHLTRLSTIDHHLYYIFTEAVAMTHSVYFLVYNNIGDAPLFPSWLQFFLKRRCIKIHDRIQLVAEHMNIRTIKLFNEEDNNPFIKEPIGLFASDGIHPSSRGYELWYHRMWRELVARGFHF